MLLYQEKLEDDSSLHSQKKLGIEDICSLLNFFLSNNCFMLMTNSRNKSLLTALPWTTQLIAQLLLIYAWKRSKNPAISAPCVAQKVWRRYVDGSFCIIKKAFHNILNILDPHISFTIEPENNGQILFLVTLVSCHNGTICVDVYRKPIYTPTDTNILTPAMT